MPNKQQNKRRQKKKPQEKKRGQNMQLVPYKSSAFVAQGMSDVRRQIRATRIYGDSYARQMALVDDQFPLRMPTADMPRTAAIRTTTVVPLSGGFNSNIVAVGPVNQTKAAFFTVYGQPGRTMVYGPLTYIVSLDDTLLSLKPIYSDKRISGSEDIFVVATPTGYISNSMTETANLDFEFARDTSKLSSDFRPIGKSKGYRYIWLNTNEILRLTTWGGYSGAFTQKTSAPYQITVNMYRWTGPDMSDELYNSVRQTAGTGDGSLRLPETDLRATMPCGYYRVEVILANRDTGGPSGEGVGFKAEVRAASTIAQVYQHCYATPVTDMNIGHRVRRTGCSLLVSNTSNALNQGGDILAARVQNTALGVPSGGSLPIDGEAINMVTLSKMASKYPGKAAKGLYTYLDFDRPTENFSQAVTSIGCPLFDLDAPDLVHAASFYALDDATRFQITVATIIEFKTDSESYPMETPSGEFAALVAARRVNNSTEYFYENPLHMSDIWRYISNAFNGLRHYATPIGVGLSSAFPEMAPVIMPAARMLQK